jgi:hypothetical protein
LARDIAASDDVPGGVKRARSRSEYELRRPACHGCIGIRNVACELMRPHKLDPHVWLHVSRLTADPSPPTTTVGLCVR